MSKEQIESVYRLTPVWENVAAWLSPRKEHRILVVEEHSQARRALLRKGILPDPQRIESEYDAIWLRDHSATEELVYYLNLLAPGGRLWVVAPREEAVREREGYTATVFTPLPDADFTREIRAGEDPDAVDLMVCFSKKPLTEMPSRVRFFNERSLRYAIRRENVSGPGVSEQILPMDAEADAHVIRFLGMHDKLTDLFSQGSRFELPKKVSADYSCGSPCLKLSYPTLDHLKSEDAEELIRELEKLPTVPFETTKAYLRIFGTDAYHREDVSLPVTNLSLMPEAVCRRGDGLLVTDWEWTYDFPIPFSFVKYRIRAAAGIPQPENICFGRMEETFQRRIRRGSVNYDEYSRMRKKETVRLEEPDERTAAQKLIYSLRLRGPLGTVRHAKEKMMSKLPSRGGDYPYWIRMKESPKGGFVRTHPRFSLIAEIPGEVDLFGHTYENYEVVSNIRDATGDYYIVMREGTEMAWDALFSMVSYFERHPETEVLYTDYDYLDEAGRREDPQFLPDFDYDLLLGYNYIAGAFVVKKEALDKIDFKFDMIMIGGWGILLELARVGAVFAHLPRVLFHFSRKLVDFGEGALSVNAALKRNEIPADATPAGMVGRYRIDYFWPKLPFISVLIPNMDHILDLDRCIRSLEEKSTYRDFEIIVIENNSHERETADYYRRIKEEYDNIRIVRYEGPFNFSKINNYGARFANGDAFLLLNNDTQMITPDALEHMAGTLMRPDVGIVGAKLFYANNQIQHGGVVIGYGGFAGHSFIGLGREENGYLDRLLVANEYSAVTAACLMVKRECFEAVEGLNEDFAVALNDVDFCLKVGNTGKHIVFDPFAEFYHYESRSRGYEDDRAKRQRFEHEIALFKRRWEDLLQEGDPHYNCNLSLKRADHAWWD